MVNKTRRLQAGLACLALGLGGLTACGDDATGGEGGGSSEDFHVLALLPVSGPIATITKMNVDGLTAAANIINEDFGGIDGRKIVIDVEDTALDPAKAVSGLQKHLSSGEKPDLLIPGLVSNELLAVLPLATQNEILTTNVGTVGNDPSEFPYNFGTMANYENNEQILAAELAAQGYETVAFLGTESATGHGVDEALRAAADDNGLTVTGSEFLDPTAVDSTPNLLKLKADDPDVVVITASGPPIGVMLSGRTKLDWDVPLYCEPSCAGNPMDQVSDPADWDGVFLQLYQSSVRGTELEKSDKFQRFMEEFTKVAGGEPTVPISSAVTSYNWLWLALGAYESTDSDDAADLAAALEGNKVSQEIRDGYLGPTEWGFSDTSHAMPYTAEDQLFTPTGPTVDGFVQVD